MAIPSATHCRSFQEIDLASGRRAAQGGRAGKFETGWGEQTVRSLEKIGILQIVECTEERGTLLALLTPKGLETVRAQAEDPDIWRRWLDQ